MTPSSPSIVEAEPEVVTVTDDDDYNASQAYADKASRRKGLLSTILSKSSSGSSSSASSKQSTLG